MARLELTHPDWKIDMPTSPSSDHPLDGRMGEASTDTQAFNVAGDTTQSMEGISTFGWDTWVFFAQPRSERAHVSEWGLGFGPIRNDVPRWSLFHCVEEGRFDDRVKCPHLYPSNPDLFRWSRSIVGSVLAGDLLDSVGSCFSFYQRSFADRPDLGRAGTNRPPADGSDEAMVDPLCRSRSTEHGRVNYPREPDVK
jgi:hypothetical protein